MNYPPQAFIIGAQKAGTTSLAFLLDQHPSIQLSSPKEPHFFSVNWDKGEEWYRSKFHESKNNLLLDASTSYAMAPISDAPTKSALKPWWGQVVPERIHNLAKDAKFIYLLRDPTDRTYSAYWHNVRAGREKLPFREAITEHPFYLETSKYHAQILIYLRYFNIDDILFMDFRNFSKYPINSANDCLKFFNVLHDDDFSFEIDSRKNKSYQFNKAGLITQKILGAQKNLEYLNSLVKRALPSFVHAYVKQLISKGIPRMDGSDRAYLEEYFEEENRKLHDLIGLDFRK